MARTVDARWFETYCNAKKVFEELGRDATLASVAHSLGMNQKTLNRMVTAGRYLERSLPSVRPGDVRCSYVQMELLEKISRISAPLAEELLPSALINQTGIAELTRRLDVLRHQSPLLAHAINARAAKRRTAKELVRDLFRFLADTPLEFFEAEGGSALKAAAISPFQAPTAAVLNRKGEPQAVLFCKVGGDSRPASSVAMELYELAMARRNMAATVWMVFPERSEVLLHLAELSLWLGGSPLHENTGWLRLGYFDDFEERLVLKVLFEDAFAELLVEVEAGQRRFEPEQFSWAGASPGKSDAVTRLGVGFVPELPQTRSRRSYTAYLTSTYGTKTRFLSRLEVQDDFGL